MWEQNLLRTECHYLVYLDLDEYSWVDGLWLVSWSVVSDQPCVVAHFCHFLVQERLKYALLHLS